MSAGLKTNAKKVRFDQLYEAHLAHVDFSVVITGHYSGANASLENLVSPL